MEGWGKCLNPEKPFEVPGVNGIAVKSKTIDVTGDHFFKSKTTIFTSIVLDLAATPFAPEIPKVVIR